MNEVCKSIEEMVEKITSGVPLAMGVYIDTSIQRETSDTKGFPLHYKYSPSVTFNAKTLQKFELKTGGDYESPDQELVRAQARCKALELGLDVAIKLSEHESAEDGCIKVNDLPIDVARQQLDVYRTELKRIKEDHEGQVWM